MAASTPLTSLVLFRFLTLLLLLRPVLALEVTPGSSCATFCLGLDSHNGFDPDASTTNSSEITCKDSKYTGEDMGIKFKSCIECLEKSEKVNGTESDLHWYLYNLRYTVTTCLFSLPAAPPNEDIDSPCVIDYACRPLKTALTADSLSPTTNDTYGYCAADSEKFMSKNLGSCISCLKSSGDQVFLSNFVIALEAGCEQKPKPGGHLTFSGSLFSTNQIIITTPAEDIREKPSGAGSSTMTTGTIVGIVVGVALFVVGAIALFIVRRRKQKKQLEDEKNGYLGQPSESPEPLFPQATQMSAPLRSYGHGGHGRSGSQTRGPLTTGEYYDRLEREVQTAGRRTYHYDPRSQHRGPQAALPAHQAYLPQTMSRSGRSRRSDRILPEQAREPSPPESTHQRSDSYPLPAYPGRTEGTQGSSYPPPPPGPPPPKVPSLVLPSAPKLRLPKQYEPPTVTVTETPVKERANQGLCIGTREDR